MAKQQSLYYCVTKYGSLCNSIRIIQSGERSMALNETRPNGLCAKQHTGSIDITMFSKVSLRYATRILFETGKLARFAARERFV